MLTKQEKLICQAIGPKLIKDGLYFVGLDIINGKLIEINVCAPGGIARINRLNKVKLQVKVLDFVEKLVNEKEKMFNEKASMRKLIQDK